jgi:hypothetical protein
LRYELEPFVGCRLVDCTAQTRPAISRTSQSVNSTVPTPPSEPRRSSTTARTRMSSTRLTERSPYDPLFGFQSMTPAGEGRPESGRRTSTRGSFQSRGSGWGAVLPHPPLPVPGGRRGVPVRARCQMVVRSPPGFTHGHPGASAQVLTRMDGVRTIQRTPDPKRSGVLDRPRSASVPSATLNSSLPTGPAARRRGSLSKFCRLLVANLAAIESIIAEHGIVEPDVVDGFRRPGGGGLRPVAGEAGGAWVRSSRSKVRGVVVGVRRR